MIMIMFQGIQGGFPGEVSFPDSLNSEAVVGAEPAEAAEAEAAAVQAQRRASKRHTVYLSQRLPALSVVSNTLKMQLRPYLVLLTFVNGGRSKAGKFKDYASYKRMR